MVTVVVVYSVKMCKYIANDTMRGCHQWVPPVSKRIASFARGM